MIHNSKKNHHETEKTQKHLMYQTKEDVTLSEDFIEIRMQDNNIDLDI